MSNSFTLNVRTDTTNELSDAELIRFCEAVYGSPITAHKIKRILLPWERSIDGWERRNIRGEVKASFKEGSDPRHVIDIDLQNVGYIVCAPVCAPVTEALVCQRGCGSPGVEAPCPFDQEINDSDELCSCCENCRNGCADDI